MDSAFWNMGGYARYVWPCIGFTLGVLGWNVWSARRLQARALTQARRAVIMARSDGTGRSAATQTGASRARSDGLVRSERT